MVSLQKVACGSFIMIAVVVVLVARHAIGSTTTKAQFLEKKSGPEIRRFLGHTGDIWCVAFSPDGRTALSGSGIGRIAVGGGRDCSIRLWDIKAGKELRSLRGHKSWVFCVAFSPNGFFAASGGAHDDRTVRLWDLKTGKEIHCLKGHTSAVKSVSFSRNGKLIISAGEEGTIRWWDIAVGKEVRCVTIYEKAISWIPLWIPTTVTSIAISPDGKSLLCGCWDSTVRVLSAETGKELKRFLRHKGEVESVVFSPDGRYALSGGGGITPEGEPLDTTLRLWNVTTGREVRIFRGHKSWIYGVAFSPDGKRVLSCGGWVSVYGERQDCSIRLWNVADGALLARYQGHTHVIRSIAFSPDGKHAISASIDQTLRLWVLPDNSEGGRD